MRNLGFRNFVRKIEGEGELVPPKIVSPLPSCISDLNYFVEICTIVEDMTIGDTLDEDFEGILDCAFHWSTVADIQLADDISRFSCQDLSLTEDLRNVFISWGVQLRESVVDDELW